jgi:hypothetical protein
MADHKKFTVATNVKVYFCDPQSPWQRGTNENTNLLLRQYFPRGTDLAPISQAQLDQVALSLNRRPEKPWASKLRQVNCKQVLHRPSEPAITFGNNRLATPSIMITHNLRDDYDPRLNMAKIRKLYMKVNKMIENAITDIYSGGDPYQRGPE